MLKDEYMNIDIFRDIDDNGIIVLRNLDFNIKVSYKIGYYNRYGTLSITNPENLISFLKDIGTDKLNDIIENEMIERLIDDYRKFYDETEEINNIK